jgi:hypothetical protein
MNQLGALDVLVGFIHAMMTPYLVSLLNITDFTVPNIILLEVGF